MTFLEHKTALRNDLSISAGDVFYTDAQIESFVNRGLKWFASLHFWADTEMARVFTLTADDVGKEYFDYPEDFYTDSIYRIDNNESDENDDASTEWIKKNWEDYLRYKNDNGTSADDDIFSSHRRQFFLNPAPSSVTSLSLWGHKIPDTLSDDADTHPFSDDADTCEIINLYSLGLALRKARGNYFNKGVELIDRARKEADAKWVKEKARRAEYQAQDNEMFNDIEIIPTAGLKRTDYGNFNCSN